jgi:hypothetical protein
MTQSVSQSIFVIPALIAMGFALFCTGMVALLLVELVRSWIRGRTERDAARRYKEDFRNSGSNFDNRK